MKKDKTPSYIKVGIFTVITTIAWIFFSTYRILTTKPAPTVPSQILAPFSPILDTQKIEEVESRIFFEEGQVSLFNIPEPSPTPSPTEAPTPVPTETQTPEPEPNVPEEIPQ